MSKKFVFFGILAFVTASIVGGCGGGQQLQQQTEQPAPPPPAEQPTAPAVADGKMLYEQNCSACHGQDAKGVAGLGRDITANSAFVSSQSDEQLLEFVKQGREASDPANTTGIAMPPKGGNPALTDEEIKAIIAYLRSLK